MHNLHSPTNLLLKTAMHRACACPAFGELDVFLGQHILLILEQHSSPKV